MTPPRSDRAGGGPARDRIAYAILPFAIAVFHLLTSAGYGIFRDELYYLACARHLDWGYVDHPSFSILVLAAAGTLFGTSLAAVRLVPAVVAGATTLIAASTARALGGQALAQRLAAWCAASFPLGIAIFGFYSMNCLDILIWTAALRILLEILAGGDPRLWLAFGTVAGVGLENKISVLFLAFGVVAGLVVARRWEILRSSYPWWGGAVAIVLFVPHLIWQASHGWPTREFMANAQALKMVRMTPWGFFGQRFIETGPPLAPVWLAGLAFLLASRVAKPYRAIGWAYLAVAVAMVAGGGKPYYMGPLDPTMLAAGCVAWESLTRGPARRWWRAGVVALAVAGGVVFAPLAKPLLPVETFIAYAKALHVTPSSGERHALGPLPQHFADMQGWESLAETVAHVRDRLPDADRRHLCIFGQNYGEAGAIDRFGPALGLPPALSAHNSYWLWGPDDCEGATWIVIGDNRETLETIFDRVELGDTFHCELCMPYENDNPIWVGRGMKMPLGTLWLKIKKYV